MIPKLRAACVQIEATAEPVKNKKKLLRKFFEAVRHRAGLIAFPENFYWRGKAADLEKIASQTPVLVREFQGLARRHHTAVLLGSVLEKSSDKKKFYNTSVLISAAGKIAARYRKIHLFDSAIQGARTRESRHIAPGKKPVRATLDGVSVGLSICYDLRFPELFRALSSQGCRILFVPSNFTETTGKAHWEVLLRARAIENLAFVVAPGQVGIHPESKIRSFGNSLIIDPWGRILVKGSRSKEEVLIADLDFKAQSRIRAQFPALRHRRL